jgi:hypothetical protein
MGRGHRAGWKKKQNKKAAKNAVSAAADTQVSPESIPTASADHQSMPENQASGPKTKAPTKGSPKPPQKEDVLGILVFTRSAFVLNLVGLVRVMQGISYWWTIILTYTFFALSVLEALFEPSLKKLRIPLLVVTLAATAWFSLAVPFAKAPLDIIAYSPPGDHSPGMVIGGISWDSHFTDLRVGIINPTDNDYREVDISIKPDKWTHEAALLSGGVGCQLSRTAGSIVSWARNSKSGKAAMIARRIGDALEAYDNVGNVYTTVASDGGYRLTCSKIMAHSTVQIILAVVVVPQSLMQGAPKVPQPKPHAHWLQSTHTPPGQGGIALNAEEWIGVNNVFDLFQAKPSPQKVLVVEKYMRGIKTYSIEKTFKIEAY